MQVFHAIFPQVKYFAIGKISCEFQGISGKRKNTLPVFFSFLRL